jgi:hypothetical protein
MFIMHLLFKFSSYNWGRSTWFTVQTAAILVVQRDYRIQIWCAQLKYVQTAICSNYLRGYRVILWWNTCRPKFNSILGRYHQPYTFYGNTLNILNNTSSSSYIFNSLHFSLKCSHLNEFQFSNSGHTGRKTEMSNIVLKRKLNGPLQRKE